MSLMAPEAASHPDRLTSIVTVFVIVLVVDPPLQAEGPQNRRPSDSFDRRRGVAHPMPRTSSHRIFGVAKAQSANRKLTFTTRTHL
jgi:hypothetical protein